MRLHVILAGWVRCIRYFERDWKEGMEGAAESGNNSGRV